MLECETVLYAVVFVCVCVCVCMWERGPRGSKGDREQWGVQHLNCLFISSHCINYSDTGHKRALCVCMWDGGRTKKQLRMIRMEMFVLSYAVSWFMRVTKKGQTVAFFLSVSRERSRGNHILIVIPLTINESMHKEHTSEWVEGLHGCVIWGLPVAALSPGAWSSALRGRGACLGKVAVISGAQRTEFIRLSRGHEPFRAATLQFVSHFASHNSLNVACLCTFAKCLIVPPL